MTSASTQVAATPTRPASRRRAMAAYVVALLVWSLTIGIPNDTLGVCLWIWIGTVAWHADAPLETTRAWWRDWWLPMVLLVAYSLLRGVADQTFVPVNVTAPIRFDEWLGGGTTPTELLQSAWCGDPCLPGSSPRWYDTLFTTVYASHFLASLGLAGVLWVRSRGEWVRWIRRFVAMNFAGLTIYFLYPMAPPWMAGRDGFIGAVSRITSRGWSEIDLHRQSIFFGGLPNKVAAMPSLHAGFSFLLVFYAIQRFRHPARWLLLIYPLTMSLSLVYSGEHYVVDAIAGALVALAVLVGCQLWENRRARAA
ncbi:phosphatase PAP2 family protein [Nocardioides sp. W7]|uniref:phosphatase PAP2 family protein n=1 Tax=Nocardioides sp. W7 TaxID=2931390 RepID=UPI001FD5C2AC|nr:phosphatase PAP2 family protein [Nocardioides sp. W7]